MENTEKAKLDEALGEVMTRFRNFFLQNMDEDHVPFRHRDDFVAPLVTIMGHTYGARIVAGDSTDLAVEISANVYDDEFDLERFEARIEAAHQPERVKKTVKNFMSPDDPDYVGKKGHKRFPALFSCNYESDLVLDRKNKKSASKVTGKLVDTVLTLKYWIQPDQLAHVTEDLVFFKSAVYFYCLRTFVLAYHESLISD